VIIGSLGLLGYVAMKAAGPKQGALLLGFIGGFMSSTAVTLNAAQAVRDRPDAAALLAASVSAAQSVMFVRTTLLVTILNDSLLPLIAMPAAVGALTAAAIGAFLFWKVDSSVENSDVPLGSPDQLVTAFEFMAVVVIALLVSYYAQMFGGDSGIIASSIVAGGVDVDAATVSVSTIAGRQANAPPVLTAAIAIISALAANSTVKTAIAYLRGNSALALRAGIGLLASALAAIAALILQTVLA
jgi:uncharacterized membrane protein (DUF4010 family)